VGQQRNASTSESDLVDAVFGAKRRVSRERAV